jgi:hypothetical protein
MPPMPPPIPTPSEVRLALDDAVAERIVGVDRPVEQLGVEAAQLLAVLPHHLEMDYRTTHLCSFL